MKDAFSGEHSVETLSHYILECAVFTRCMKPSTSSTKILSVSHRIQHSCLCHLSIGRHSQVSLIQL